MLDNLLELSPNLGINSFLLLLVLVALEAVLSADNAIALAALVQGIPDIKQQERALNFGLVLAFVLRVALIFSATWVIQFWQFELAGAIYLLWLSYKYFTSEEDNQHQHRGLDIHSVWKIIPILAITDLAFSLDSVTTAIALSDERWLILTGGVIGIIVLRFMAELFIRWLQIFTHLQDAGYLTVTLVGLRLLLRVVDSEFVLPDWLMVTAIGLCFAWGFSQRNDPASVSPGPETVISVANLDGPPDEEPLSVGSTHKSTELS